ncbi:MAG: Fic family protein [Gordonia sp. (in: high G+C Gram-positive bacteria)]|uniref:Fic family protein n=1 Tax=Gordonia sp. (in: high G+C Gram-positive bacteria) TaxID=84139 RepID=UPI0039E54543
MFALMTPEVAVLIERIMSLEPKIRAEWEQLPGSARHHYLNRMVIDEIQATNEIEQVRSTRKEIREAIKAVRSERVEANSRFTEMVRLYLDIGDDEAESPQTLDDVRAVYDAVTRGEIGEEDSPDGRRFRRGPVSIESGTRVVHTGVMPESAIDDALTLMLSQGRDDSIPRLIRAVVAHFIFEYTHPFYDGNGRTGRYLLALDLRQVLAPYASLALSATVADNKDRYYRAFANAENPLNRGDLTPYLIDMMEIIAEAQHRLFVDLAGLRKKIEMLEGADPCSRGRRTVSPERGTRRGVGAVGRSHRCRRDPVHPGPGPPLRCERRRQTGHSGRRGGSFHPVRPPAIATPRGCRGRRDGDEEAAALPTRRERGGAPRTGHGVVLAGAGTSDNYCRRITWVAAHALSTPNSPRSHRPRRGGCSPRGSRSPRTTSSRSSWCVIWMRSPPPWTAIRVWEPWC